MRAKPIPRLLCALGLGAAALASNPAAALPPNFIAEEILTGLNFPTAIRFAPGGRLFFAELGGRVGYYPRAEVDFPVTWKTFAVSNEGERGLLGMEIHPDFPDSPYVYVYYTQAAPLKNRLVRIREQQQVGGAVAVLLELPADALFHHGGRIAFGPDGMIYLTYGDQENTAEAQTTSSPRGKIHRLSRGGKPAPGNPWAGNNTACLLGVRNPFGLAFDPLDGTGYFTENGPHCDDEVNLIALGANYGWGPSDFCGGQPSGAFPALTTFGSTIAPTGCVVYRSGGFPSNYAGNLFFGSFNDNTVRRLVFRPEQPGVVDSIQTFLQLPDPVLDVTVDSYGMLYASTPTSIWRVRYAPVVGVTPPPPAPIALVAAPNPFRDRVRLTPVGAPAGTRVDLFDLQGRRVRSFDAPLPSTLTWDGRTESGDLAPAGVYLAQATGPGYATSRRLVRLGN